MNLCPQCSRSMRPHCKARCGWLLCGVCNIVRDTGTGRVVRPIPFGKEQENGR